MGALKAAIDALETVSIVIGAVPLVGENVKAAVELASKICEQVQVRRRLVLHKPNGIHRLFRSEDERKPRGLRAAWRPSRVPPHRRRERLAAS
jgi:hypothetical protein